MKCVSYNRFFEVIGNPTRLKIIDSLYRKAKCVTELCEDIHEEQSKVSHNLKILKNCHFVDIKQDGKMHIYSLNQKTIIPIIKMVDTL